MSNVSEATLTLLHEKSKAETIVPIGKIGNIVFMHIANLGIVCKAVASLAT